MSSRRTVILVAAVVIGLVAALLVFNYVNGADNRAKGDVEEVTVLKLTGDIPAGATAAEALEAIVEEKIPRKDKAATAINDTAIIAGKVAAYKLPANTQLLEGMFVDPVESSASHAGRVPDDCGVTADVKQQCVAVTLQFDKVHSVAGLVSPGDRVNILTSPTAGEIGPIGRDRGNVDLCATFNTDAVFDGLSPAARQALFQLNPEAAVEWLTCLPAQYLYQSVKVLFVDQESAGTPAAATSTDPAAAGGGTPAAVDTGLITFAVPPRAAAILISFGNLYLTLLPDNYDPVALPPFDPTFPLLPGEDANVLTPYGPLGFPEN